MKKLITFTILAISLWSHAQNGITYQAVILNPNSEELPGVDNSRLPLVNQNVTLEFKILNAGGFFMETQIQDNNRINIVFNYVKDHFQEQISLDVVAEMASMTVPSFCRYFKKITKKTFTKFVNEYRIVHASKLLAEKPIGITEVCYESGFNNFSHFNKLFKEFTGKSASQYRQELKSVIK